MKNTFPLVGTAAAVTFLMFASTGHAATFSELDTNGDNILTEQEFIDALGSHHGPIAYRQYNTNAEPIIILTEEEVQATDPDGNPLFEQTPIMVQETDAQGNPVTDAEGSPIMIQATDAEGNPQFEQGDPIMETVVIETKVDGVAPEEIRRSDRGFDRSNAGKARANANRQRAAENKSGVTSNSSNRGNGGSKGNKGGNGRNK